MLYLKDNLEQPEWMNNTGPALAKIAKDTIAD